MIFNSETQSRIDFIFNAQKDNVQTLSSSNCRQRKAKLKRLKKALFDYRQDIRQAMYDDFRKHPSEVDMTEIYPIVSEINHSLKHLRNWMAGERVHTPIALFGSRSRIKYEAKGNTLIVSPWNFPINLSLVPLVSAVAAGNAVIIKPSEHTPHSSAVIQKIVEACFDQDEVAVVQGEVETSKYLLTKKFHHIFFTGSPEVGKRVMKAASEHLCSVTLELGGKSPTIVDASADIDKAAKRIVWGKFVNNGQICIAPDYILVDATKEKLLLDKLAYYIKEFYSENIREEPSYARIVNDKHYERLQTYIDEALDDGAECVTDFQSDPEERLMTPVVLTNVKLDTKVMQEEIFGPLLPVIPYSSNSQLLDIINSKPKALALYIYSRDKKNINAIINNTSSGATCINHNGVHFYNTNLPFGGVNNSGIGKAHGFYGFKEFSNARAVFQQLFPNALELLVPPYNSFKQKLIDITLKYF